MKDDSNDYDSRMLKTNYKNSADERFHTDVEGTEGVEKYSSVRDHIHIENEVDERQLALPKIHQKSGHHTEVGFYAYF